MKTLILLLLVSQAAFSDDWICKQESSVREGQSIHSCGIGEGSDEDAARTQAFEHAKAEFDRICGSDAFCYKTAYTVQPKRTTCDEVAGGYRCFRMIVFNLQADSDGKPVKRPRPSAFYHRTGPTMGQCMNMVDGSVQGEHGFHLCMDFAETQQ
jgi:hypothetical protein